MSDILPKKSGAFFDSGNTGRAIAADAFNLFEFCSGFYSVLGLNPEISQAKLWNTLAEHQTILIKNVSIARPSVFKLSAAFTIAFVLTSPLDQPLASGRLDPKLTEIPNHQNALIPFEYCRYILCGAKINHPKRGDIELKKRINLSKHFKIDLIHSIAAINRDGANFHLLSLIYESLCYKANPKASDKELV